MDNAVGSLTQFQRSVIIGTILGDGYVRIFPNRKNALLEINHSYNAKDYVEWKYSVLSNVSGSWPKMRNGKNGRKAYRFYTKQLPELTELFNKFYRNNKKIIPEDLILDSIILAVWFMDDGSKCSQSDFYLNTQQYSVDDQIKLVTKLKMLGLESRLNKDKKYWRIRFLKSSIPKLNELISDKILSSMRYKIDN